MKKKVTEQNANALYSRAKARPTRPGKTHQAGQLQQAQRRPTERHCAKQVCQQRRARRRRRHSARALWCRWRRWRRTVGGRGGNEAEALQATRAAQHLEQWVGHGGGRVEIVARQGEATQLKQLAEAAAVVEQALTH